MRLPRQSAFQPKKSLCLTTIWTGGGGRRLEVDYVPQAVLIAKQVKGPVKATWTREEDIQHDYYRYLNNSRVIVGPDAAGKPISWRHRVIGSNVSAPVSMV